MLLPGSEADNPKHLSPRRDGVGVLLAATGKLSDVSRAAASSPMQQRHVRAVRAERTRVALACRLASTALLFAGAVVGCDRSSDESLVEIPTAPKPPSATPENTTVPPARSDPAKVAGLWTYRTRSNCGTVDGVGQLSFEWVKKEQHYYERGCVFWSHSGLTIYWWGKADFDSATRTLRGKNQNSLGDEVDGQWSLQGAKPDRLVVRWNQTNGCRGVGVATRSDSATSARDALDSAYRLTLTGEPADESPCSALDAGPHRWPGRRAPR